MMMYPGSAWRESAVADPTLAVAHQPAFEKCEFSSWAFKETVLHATITPTTSSSTTVFSHASPDSLLATPEVGEVCVWGDGVTFRTRVFAVWQHHILDFLRNSNSRLLPKIQGISSPAASVLTLPVTSSVSDAGACIPLLVHTGQTMIVTHCRHLQTLQQK